MVARRDSGCCCLVCNVRFPAFCSFNSVLYQRHMGIVTVMPKKARQATLTTLPRPNGAIKRAAISGPTALPVLPPTWNTDWANPLLPPDASEVSLEASGCRTEEPSPTRDTLQSTTGNDVANPNIHKPVKVKLMPKGRKYGLGFLSRREPITG